MKVKPWGKNQGEYVTINVEKFDPEIHKKFGEEEPKKTTKVKRGADS